MENQPTRDSQGTGLKSLDERIAAIKKVLSQFEPKPSTVTGTPDHPVESETELPLERET